MDRRNFIEKLFITAGAVALPSALWAEKKSADSLFDVFKSVGFDPSKKGSQYFVMIADPHYAAPNTPHKSSAMKCMPTVLKEIKAQPVSPAFVITLGDLGSSGNPCFGASITNTDKMNQEFEMFKSHMAEIAPIPYKVVVGNHDCKGPRDLEFADFKKAFGKKSTYESFDFNGMHCVILNGGHTGALDEAQEKWFFADMKKIKGNQNVIIFVHQPLGAVRSEWKLSESVRKAADKHAGDIFVFAGHNHANNVCVLLSPSGKRVRQVTVEAFRQNDAPVYWVCAVRNGEVVATIFRDKNGKFEAIDAGNRKAGSWSLPWEGTEIIAAFNNSSPEWHETKRKGGDCVYFYFYLRSLEGWLDLSNIKEPFSKLYLMGTTIKHRKDSTKDAVLELSADGEKFEPVKIEVVGKNIMYKVDLPQNLKNAKKLYFKMNFPFTDGGFTGFAIAK